MKSAQTTVVAALGMLAALVSISGPQASAAMRDATPDVSPLARHTAATARHAPPEPRALHAPRPKSASAVVLAKPTVIGTDALNATVKTACASCHSAQRRMGNLALHDFNLSSVADSAPEVAEKIIEKLRTGMMPPPGRPRPAGDTLDVLMTTLERRMDAKALRTPNPGTRTFQRLNVAEYERSVKDVLNIDISGASWLPLDTKSANFDNIADVQMPSATTLDAYLDAASDIARLAVGDPAASVSTSTYKIARLASQLETVDGAPRGTRGGVSVTHNFPADGEYVFAVTLQASPTGQLYGSAAPFDEKIEISVNGERMALLDIDRGMSQADPLGMDMRTPPIPVRAGPQRITAAYTRTFEGPVNDNLAPIGHSIADTQIGLQSAVTTVSHIQTFAVSGPFNPTGVSDTPSRRRIFSCRPTSPAEARPCAQRIVARLAASAYRRPVNASDMKSLMAFYDDGAKRGFEPGVRSAVEAILASPHFLFRVEGLPAKAKTGDVVRVNGADLASRLSFFLWGAPPDSLLLSLAARGVLHDPAVLSGQARRMLADARAEALATRFAAQWLRLQDVEKVHPDALQFPDFHEQLALDMRRETEQFFHHVMADNRSLLELYTANYSYMNERLARHYGINGVTGNAFRRVAYPDSTRRGLLGHASILTLTSHANRTSPVLRGKWVMEVLMGSPPPPPPPNVPDLEKTGEHKDGRMLTTRARMELHRDNASCRSCHLFIDPIGLALDNFDVTGQWRVRENGESLDTRGDFYDGTRISSPIELQRALLKRPVPLVRAFTANLMAYALGRRMEYYDQATIRRVEAQTQASNFRLQDVVIAVIKSDAFRMRRVSVAARPTGFGTATDALVGRGQ